LEINKSLYSGVSLDVHNSLQPSNIQAEYQIIKSSNQVEYSAVGYLNEQDSCEQTFGFNQYN